MRKLQLTAVERCFPGTLGATNPSAKGSLSPLSGPSPSSEILSTCCFAGVFSFESALVARFELAPSHGIFARTSLPSSCSASALNACDLPAASAVCPAVPLDRRFAGGRTTRLALGFVVGVTIAFRGDCLVEPAGWRVEARSGRLFEGGPLSPSESPASSSLMAERTFGLASAIR